MKPPACTSIHLTVLAAVFALWSAGCADDSAGTRSGESSSVASSDDTGSETESGSAESGAADILISVSELKSALDDPNLRLLDVRSSEDYAAGHIPGAVRVDLAEWKSLALSEGGLHAAQSWNDQVGSLGVDGSSRVVVYSNRPTDATRIWWTLKYLGVDHTAVLDGGWDYWTSQDGETSTDTPTVDPVAFRARFQTDRLAEIGDLKDSIQADDEVAIVDARTDAEFAGTGGPGTRHGRVPGAVHIEWTSLVTEDGRFKSKDQLQEIFQQHNLEIGKKTVTYCQSGGRASLDAFALELAGYENVQNYYCSWQEWSADEEAPVEKSDTEQ